VKQGHAMYPIRSQWILPAINVTVKVESGRKTGPRAQLACAWGRQDAAKECEK